MANIFLVYGCDEWKSTSSEKLLMATTSVRKLKSFIAKKIEDKDFEYRPSLHNSREKRAAQFRKDFGKLTRSELNDHLVYGRFELAHDGEEL